MSEVRTCTRCGATESLVDFPARGRRCLACRRQVVREHYAKNRTYYLTKARRRQLAVLQETRQWLIEYLSEHPCQDCGNSDIRVLEFDHRDGESKTKAVSVLARAGYSLDRVKAEVGKCDVRCANCHRIRTHKQRRWWSTLSDVVTSAPGEIRTPKPSDP